MNKKILLSIMLILCMLFSAFTFVSAQEVPSLKVSATEWDENNEFDLILSVENNPGISAFDFSISFDGKLIQPVRVYKAEALTGSEISNLSIYDAFKDEPLKIAYFGTEELVTDEDVFKVRFKISDYASSANSGQEVEINLLHLTGFHDVAANKLEFDLGSCVVVLPEIAEDKPVATPPSEDEQEDVTPNVPASGGDPLAPQGGGHGTVNPGKDEEAEADKAPAVTMVLVIDSVMIQANDNTIINDVAPKIVNERTMLPIRIIAETLGATVEWDDELKKVTITSVEGNVIEFVIGESVAYVNGEEYALDSPAFIENERTYSPVRFVSEQLKADVEWNDELNQVTITK